MRCSTQPKPSAAKTWTAEYHHCFYVINNTFLRVIFVAARMSAVQPNAQQGYRLPAKAFQFICVLPRTRG